MKGDKQEITGYIKVFRLMGAIVTERYCIHPKKGEDLLTRLMKQFNRRKVRITVEDIDESKEMKVTKQKGFFKRFLEDKTTSGHKNPEEGEIDETNIE